MLYALSKLKLICLNRELMWDDVYQVFMAKSTFLSPFLHVTFDVLCKDRSCSGLYCISSLFFILGYFKAHSGYELVLEIVCA